MGIFVDIFLYEVGTIVISLCGSSATVSDAVVSRAGSIAVVKDKMMVFFWEISRLTAEIPFMCFPHLTNIADVPIGPMIPRLV